MSKPLCNYAAPYDFSNPLDYSKGDPYGEGWPWIVVDDGSTGGGSGSSVRSGGIVSTQTGRPGDTTRTSTSGDTPADPDAPDVASGLDVLLASPLQALFNLALAQASQPKAGAIVLSPDQATAGSSFMSLKNIILIVLIGGGIWYVVRKYASK